MNDKRLSEILASLPRETAAANFTARVQARLERQPTTLFAPGRWSAIAAAAAIIALVSGFGWQEWRHAREKQAAVARLTQLLDEKHDLEEELRTLRRLTDEARPVVYLGGNEDVDLVLDLARLSQRQTHQPQTHQRQTLRSGPLTPDAFSPANLRTDPRRSLTAVY